MQQISEQQREKIASGIELLARNYFGVAELVCEKDSAPINPQMRKWRDACIIEARRFRKALLEKYDIIVFGHSIYRRDPMRYFSLHQFRQGLDD